MTTTLTPVTIAGQIYTLPESLAADIETSRTRLDAMTEEDEEDEEEEDEEPMSFVDKMKAAKAKAAAKKDSLDADSVVSHIDALEAENEVLAAMIQNQQPHEDADDEDDEEEMDDRTPEEIATERIAAFMKAKPFLRPEAQITDYGDVYDIFEDAIGTRYPNAFGIAEDGEDDGMGGYRIDPDDADELRGAFYLMCLASNPMQQTPVMSMDSKDADRSFAEALGLRTDSTVSMPEQRPQTQYY